MFEVHFKVAFQRGKRKKIRCGAVLRAKHSDRIKLHDWQILNILFTLDLRIHLLPLKCIAVELITHIVDGVHV